MRYLWFRFRNWVRGRRADAELDDELAFHHAQEVDKLRRRGVSDAEAERLANVAFGSRASAIESSRQARGLPWIDELTRDLLLALRAFARAPIFVVTVAGSLVLGLCANVTMFTLVRASLWRPLPLPAAEQIVHVRRFQPRDPAGRETTFSYALFQELADAGRPAVDIVAKRTPVRRRFGLTSESPERVVFDAVSDRWFGVLGVRPVTGRLVSPGDDGLEGGRAVAVLSHRFWNARFQADPNVVGKAVFIDERRFTIVGVAEPGFTGVDAETSVDVWVPLTADPAIDPTWLRGSSTFWLTLMGRAVDASSLTATESALDARFRSHVTRDLLPRMPARLRSRFEGERIQLRHAAAGLATTGRRYSKQIGFLWAVAGCVLLLCCLNVANMVRARNDARDREFAVRRALGASHGRLFRQLATEGAVIASIAVALALALAPWTSGLLLGLVPGVGEALDLRPDPVIVIGAASLAALATLIAVVLPAWRATDAASALKSGSRTSVAWKGRRAIVASQFALALVLLAVAGTCLVTMRRLQAVPIGFDPDSVLEIALTFPRAADANGVASETERIRNHLAQLPAVESATYVSPGVYADSSGMSMAIVPEGYVPAAGEDVTAGVVDAGPAFFETIRIPVRRGRTFEPADVVMSKRVVLVNDAFVRKYGSRAEVGRRVQIPSPGGPILADIIGVAADARHYGVRSDVWPMVYRPGGSALLVRTIASARELREAIASTGSVAQVENVRPLADTVRAVIGAERLLATLSAIVGAIATTLAALGLYGLVAYGVVRRRREISVRAALGARPADLQAMVIRDTLRLAIVGIGLGIIGAVFAANLVQKFVAESAALDWQTLTLASTSLVGAATIAGWLPAWRAARVDPAETLKAE